MLSPKVIDDFEVCFGDELGLGEEHVATFLGGLPRQNDEEAASFFVGLPELLLGEVFSEEIERDCLGGGGRGGGGG